MQRKKEFFVDCVDDNVCFFLQLYKIWSVFCTVYLLFFVTCGNSCHVCVRAERVTALAAYLKSLACASVTPASQGTLHVDEDTGKELESLVSKSQVNFYSFFVKYVVHKLIIIHLPHFLRSLDVHVDSAHYFGIRLDIIFSCKIFFMFRSRIKGRRNL